MRVREFMTTNVLTVPSNTPISEARRLMAANRIRRMPVVDNGKLVGMVGFQGISDACFSSADTLSAGGISEPLDKMTVGEVMRKNIVTITPNTTAESALAIAQENKVGSLPVLNNGHLVGIVTTNDFVYRIMNPLLGLGKPGTRIHIFDCGESRQIEEVIGVINKNGLAIEALHIDSSRERITKDLIVQVNTTDPSEAVVDIASLGYTVEIRDRKSWPVPEKKS